MTVHFRGVYPATANGSAAKLGGLPLTAANLGTNIGVGALFTTAASPNGMLTAVFTGNTKTFEFINNSAGGWPTNAQMSGGSFTNEAVA